MPGRRVFSGVQPAGKLHLGNCVGALSLWVAAQAEHEAVFCIADVHALTIPEVVRDARLPGKIRDGARRSEREMSKSLAEVRSGHAIALTDPPEAIRDAIMRAVTDSGREVRARTRLSRCNEPPDDLPGLVGS